MKFSDHSSKNSENTYSLSALIDFDIWFYSLDEYQTSFLVNKCHKTEE